MFREVVSSLELIVTTWAISAITAAAALIIIVVFRNEIRSVLQTTNLRALFWGRPGTRPNPPLEAVAQSVFHLARQRCGALLVFPGKESIKDHTQNGVSWKGAISREMIGTIFFKDNPVHDGAAVIQGAQISEVGVILPLSQRKDLPLYYGTRHRAALGLSEATDALVVVVSEERGSVTAALGTELLVMESEAELMGLLRKHLGVQSDQGAAAVREKKRMALAAGISILIILGVWINLSRGRDTLTTLEVPLEYVNRSPNTDILQTSVTSLRLQLSGSRALMRSLRTDQIQVRVDLSNAEIGTNTYPITPKNLSLPPGISLNRVQPPEVTVEVDSITEKILPVQVDWSGRLNKDLILENAVITPERVQVKGPSRILATMHTVYTAPVHLDKLAQSGSITMDLAIDRNNLRLAQDTGDKVTVQYVIQKRMAEKDGEGLDSETLIQ